MVDTSSPAPFARKGALKVERPSGTQMRSVCNATPPPRSSKEVADFEMRERRYAELPRLLCEWSPSFASSLEAAQIAEDFGLPTVVADAFGEYVLRLASEGDYGEEVRVALAAVERMAGSDEQDVRYCAIEGLLSKLNGTQASRALIPMLGSRSGELYLKRGSDWR